VTSSNKINAELLLQDIREDPERSGVWNFYNPKNLYLTDSQSKIYLELMGDIRYSSRFHDKTETLIKTNSKKIIDHFNEDSLLIIDLGPGYPSKTFPIIDDLKKQKKEIEYWGVDINQHFANIAKRTMLKRGISHSFSKIISFEVTADALKKSGTNCQKLIIIGLTFMNFEPGYILNILKSCASGEKDVCLTAVECADNAKPLILMKPYKTKEVERFLFIPLSFLGVKESEVSYNVEFHAQRIEMFFIFNKVPPLLKEKGIKEGDKIITAISYRYTTKQYQDLLRSRFTKNEFFKLENTVLGISRK